MKRLTAIATALLALVGVGVGAQLLSDTSNVGPSSDPTSTLTNLEITGTLDVTGAATITGAQTFTGSTTFSGDITATSTDAVFDGVAGVMHSVTICNDTATSSDEQSFLVPFAGTLVACSYDAVSGAVSFEIDNTTQSEGAWLVAQDLEVTHASTTTFATAEFDANDVLTVDFGTASTPIGVVITIWFEQTAVSALQ